MGSQVVHNVIKKRTSKGKQKILNMERIANKSSRQVTFSKRKAGLFKKTAQLCAEFGAHAAVFAFSESGRAFSFGNPDAESVLQRYLTSSNDPNFCGNQPDQNSGSVKKQFWWDKPIDFMGLEELDEYKASLEGLRKELALRINAKSGSVPQSFGCSPMYGTYNASDSCYPNSSRVNEISATVVPRNCESGFVCGNSESEHYNFTPQNCRSSPFDASFNSTVPSDSSFTRSEPPRFVDCGSIFESWDAQDFDCSWMDG